MARAAFRDLGFAGGRAGVFLEFGRLADIHVSFGMFMALPIILNEDLLGIWLIVKGFNPNKLMLDSAENVIVRLSSTITISLEPPE